MSGPADAYLHEPNSDTCDSSPTHRKAEPGGVLRSVNILAAAQDNRHVSSASRTARASKSPCVASAQVPQLFHFTAGLERKPAFPSRWHAPESIGGGHRGVW